MLVLGIETSCDETGAALYDTARGLVGNRLHTQMAMHAEYGGVVPELASRDHIRRLVPLTQACLREAGADFADIDAVAYTQGPGLGGAAITRFWVKLWTMPQAKPLIKRENCWGWTIPPARSSPNLPAWAIRKPSAFPVPCCILPICR